MYVQLLGTAPEIGDMLASPPSVFTLECRPDGQGGSSCLGPGTDLRSIGRAEQDRSIGPDAVITHISISYLGDLNCLSDCPFGVSSLAGHLNSN